MEMIAEGRRIDRHDNTRTTDIGSRVRQVTSKRSSCASPLTDVALTDRALKDRVIKDRPSTGRPLRRETESALAGYAPFTSGEFLAFHLGNEEYCIEILKVLEIRSHQAATRIANAPAHMTGMIDLRGAIVPVIDLRLLFGMKAAVVSTSTVTIVLNILGRTIGMVVDSVYDVVQLARGSIKPTRLPAAVIAANGIAGIAMACDRMLVVLDVEALFRNPKVGLMN